MRLLDRLTSPSERAAAVAVVQTQNGSALLEPFTDFDDYVKSGYYQNGIVFACVAARARLLSEVEFAFRRFDGTLFTNADLGLLEVPWPNGTTGDLVWRMEQDASLSGNAYVHRTPDGLQRLDPGKMQVVSDGMWVAGYFYHPNGLNAGPVTFLPVEDVAHWTPVPDPLRPYMGMSWMAPVASEILGDREMERHRRKFFENAATPNMIVKLEQALDADARREFEKAIAKRYGSVENAYKTMVVDRGADVQMVGSSFQDMQFVDVQAQGEIRICQAAGVPPQLVGTQLGLKSSTFTNYTQAFRWFVDATARPLWRSMAGALSTIVDVPDDAELWYDDRRVPALQQDAKDQADIFDANARTIGVLVRAGFTADSSRDAVTNGNFDVLEHTGLVPNTLQNEEDMAADGMSPGDEDALIGDADEDK